VLEGLLYSTIPPSPDQWFLDYTGWMVTNGAVPYHTFADGNWPACHWLHALSTMLFGNTEYAWRAFDFLLMILCIGFAADLLRRMWGRAAALWMICLYPALYVVLGQWFAGQRDVLAGNLSFVALWFYWRGLTRREPAWQLGTGLIVALAVLVKPTCAFLGITLAAHAALGASVRDYRARDAFGQVGVAGLSTIGGIGLGFLLLVLQGTSLAMFWEMGVENIILRFADDKISIGFMLSRAVWRIAQSWHWIILLAIGSLAGRFLIDGRAGLWANCLFPIAWLAAAASYFAQASGLGYTLGMAFAATIPIVCSGLGALTERLTDLRGWTRWAAVLALLLPVGGTAKKWWGFFPSSTAYIFGEASPAQHFSRFKAGDDMTTWEAMALAYDLRERIPEGRTVLVWGRANVINFLSGRPQPTRFHHNRVLIRPGIPPSLVDHWNVWFREELEENKPVACVVNLKELDELPLPLPESAIFLRQFLDRYYEPVRMIGESMVYLRVGHNVFSNDRLSSFREAK
jgi:hypothetical protein